MNYNSFQSQQNYGNEQSQYVNTSNLNLNRE